MPKSTSVRSYHVQRNAVAEPVKTGPEQCNRCHQAWHLHDTPDNETTPVPWESCLKALWHNLAYYKEEARTAEQRAKDTRLEWAGRLAQAQIMAVERERAALKGHLKGGISLGYGY